MCRNLLSENEIKSIKISFNLYSIKEEQIKRITFMHHKKIIFA